MFREYYNKSTLSTPLPSQTVARCLITLATTKSIWQTSLSMLKNHFWKVHVKWINQCMPNTKHSPVTQITDRVGDKLSCSRILSDGAFQLTKPWSAKISVKEAQIFNRLFPRSPGNNFLKNLYRKSLNICKDPRSSGTIFTDPQGKKAHISV